MRIKQWLHNIFHFNKQERNGVFVLCIIIIVLFSIKLCLPLFIGNNSNVKLLTINLPIIKNDETVSNNYSKTSYNKQKIYNNLNSETERFVFNPNTLSIDDALKLGFSPKLSQTLINYRNKGGKFFKPEDLKKLYGVSDKLFSSLEDYILIPNTKKVFETKFKIDTVSQNRYPKSNYEKKTYTKEILELNSADSLQIVYLKGIGPGFTKRILKYRSLLGGFHSINQLKEIYGMTDSLYQAVIPQIKLDKTKLTKLPINAIDFNTLRKHPYFGFASAQAIINFKFKHGKLIEKDIIELGIFNDEKLKLILPYLSYQ